MLDVPPGSLPRLPRLPALLALALGFAALLSGCGDSPDTVPGAAEAIDDPFAGGYPIYYDEDDDLRVIVGTPDLGAGEPRVSLAFFGSDGVVVAPSVTVRVYSYPDGPGGDREGPLAERRLAFAEFPLGGRGIYRGSLPLPEPGLYALEAEVPRTDGGVASVLVPLEVAAEPQAPDIGDPAPASEHRTLDDVGAIEELTTSYAPDPALYETTVAEALDAGRPLVVVFASPAFCTTALCGPQAELASELAAEYGDRAAFVHIDLYENPHEIQGDLDRARRSPVLDEWGIETDQWTFVVESDGLISARFEGFVPRDELEAALLQVLETD